MCVAAGGHALAAVCFTNNTSRAQPAVHHTKQREGGHQAHHQLGCNISTTPRPLRCPAYYAKLRIGVTHADGTLRGCLAFLLDSQCAGSRCIKYCCRGFCSAQPVARYCLWCETIRPLVGEVGLGGLWVGRLVGTLPWSVKMLSGPLLLFFCPLLWQCLVPLSMPLNLAPVYLSWCSQIKVSVRHFPAACLSVCWQAWELCCNGCMLHCVLVTSSACFYHAVCVAFLSTTCQLLHVWAGTKA
jgi:hypothetical protein